MQTQTCQQRTATGHRSKRTIPPAALPQPQSPESELPAQNSLPLALPPSPGLAAKSPSAAASAPASAKFPRIQPWLPHFSRPLREVGLSPDTESQLPDAVLQSSP